MDTEKTQKEGEFTYRINRVALLQTASELAKLKTDINDFCQRLGEAHAMLENVCKDTYDPNKIAELIVKVASLTPEQIALLTDTSAINQPRAVRIQIDGEEVICDLVKTLEGFGAYRAVTHKLIELLADEVGEYNVIARLKDSGVVSPDMLKEIIVDYQEIQEGLK